ncbi:MAG: flagellar export chaperone FliS [Deltaproteobacteria bacterium]|nr:flagellar export chaperone FliS [Deltaproteobacteria bacterium]
MTTGYGRYSQAYQKAAVNTLDQGKLIVMLYDGAIKFLTLGADKLDKGQFFDAHENILKGKSIVAELMGSLNMEKGGDIALNLQRLYVFMFNELIEANVNRQSARVRNVVNLLKEVREGWKAIPAGGKEPQQAADSGQLKSINVRG